jgi:periplasmic divalent cation tolerance protein
MTTVPEQADAKRIAASLVAKRLAACVQIRGPIESTYRWRGEVEKSQEWVCAIKTRSELFRDVEQAIRDLHSYDEPEIIALPIVAGSEGYLAWLAESTKAASS